VLIHGLSSQTRHNGCVGVVVAHDRGSSGRYLVQLQDGSTISLKPENVRRLVRCTAIELSSAPELNGQCGYIVGMDLPSGRVHVCINGKMVALLPQNIRLEEGAMVTVHGLTGSSHLNGQEGRIIDNHSDSQRCLVQLQNGSMIKVRSANLRAIL
jgi:hypothetical protein